ncbi:hypothetical protein [Methanobacterium spitsbergense]|uniref:Uncharacterized protein n=1 Tax=Methanobacterium spitsbergense TaxID=2874285 RepID=A0A8T5V1T3_9EURY|nr:hypothetical protein [Methanobacterium spitsbergense]MBZ2167013.1 hypothetical protein [Methanobacterium spitsbergense]
MSKFWKHVDFLIPEDKKVQITEEEANIRSTNSMNALSKIQMKQVNKDK